MEKLTQLPDSLDQNLRNNISLWEPELRQCLPNLTETFDISFNNRWLISFTGTGGFAASEKRIELAFDPNFEGDRDEQMKNFRGSFFHEAYHLVQGFVGADESLRGISILENAIYEGAATKFEVIRAGTSPGWSQYDSEEIHDWFLELSNLNDNSDYRRWKFYDAETGRRWIAYRTG